MLSYYEYDHKQKKIILFLKFAFNTDLGPKKMFAWPTNDNFLLQNQPKVQIILAVLFAEIGENYARNDKLCQKLC